MKRIFILIMTCLLSFSMIFSTACANKESAEIKEKQSLFNDGIHFINYTETNDYLIKDGKSEYKLLIAREHSKYIDQIVEDFIFLFQKATGIELPVVYDDEVYFDNNSRFISLGKNAIFNQTGIRTDEYDIDRHGYIIKTLYKSIFIAGDFDRGTMYGAYQMLEEEFNFDCYSNLVFYIDEGVTEVKLKDYDVVDVPDIKNRAAMSSFIMNYKTAMNRTRVVGRDSETFIGSASAHTYMYYVPKEKYAETHPEWYSGDKTQLCLTAGGDEESRQELLNVVFEGFKREAMLESMQEAYLFIFGHEDHGNWCKCTACAAAKEKYNQSNAAVAIWFCNDLAEMIVEWFDSEEGRPYKRDPFYVIFTAYQHTETPPTNYDPETDTYTPIDDSVICHPNVAVEFAPGNMDFQNSLFHDINTPFRKNFDAWASIAHMFNIYRYQINYNFTLMPYDTFSTEQEFYQYAASKNTYWFFNEGNRGVTDAATGWLMLKNYICSKLEWNVNYDVNELIDNYFNHAYGAGGESMRKFFEEYRVHSKDLIDNYDFTRTNSLYHSCVKAKYWPKQLLDRWLGYVEDALDSIEYLKKVDMEKYLVYYDTITTERVSLHYMITTLYGKSSRYSKDFIAKITAEMNEDMSRLGIV